MDERRLNKGLTQLSIHRMGDLHLVCNLLLICVNLRHLRIELPFLGSSNTWASRANTGKHPTRPAQTGWSRCEIFSKKAVIRIRCV